MSVGDKVVIPPCVGSDGLTLRELLVVAFAIGGCSSKEAIQQATETIAVLDRREGDRRPGVMRVAGFKTQGSSGGRQAT